MAKIRTESAESVKKQINPDEEILDLRDKLTKATERLEQYKRQTGSIKSFFRDVEEAIVALDPDPIEYKQPTKDPKVLSPCSAVAQHSDGHLGKVQDADEVEGFNMVNPDITIERSMRFMRGFLEWVFIHRSSYRINEAVILSTGDHISGDIHDDLRVTNAYPAPVQTVEAGKLFSDMIHYIAPHFEKVRIEYVTEDNHSRLTRKPQAREAGLNTFNYIVAHIAKQRLKKHKNVEFNIYPKYSELVKVQNQRYLITHGHEVKGWAGFPYYGIERKAGREAIRRMMSNLNKFDKIIMGHWHSPLTHPWYWIGGSVSGTDAYDHKNGRHAEPSQPAWIVHPKYGEFDRTDFTLG